MKVINVTPEMTVLPLGRLGENEVTQFVFDVSDWLEEYPGGTIGLAHSLPHARNGYACTIESEGDGKYSWTITSAELTTEGSGRCELLLIKDSKVKKGKVYKTLIGEAVDNTANPPSVWQGYVTDVLHKKEDAEAYAVGKRSGIDVGETDPTYHNNAKYYSEQASGSATTAGNKAQDAEAYAVGKRGGTDVESSDPAYHNNSKYYAENCESIIEEATETATAAVLGAAEQVVDEYAKTSEAYAKGTRGGNAVGSSDPAYHNNSKYYAEQAENAVISANAAKTAAQAAQAAAEDAAAEEVSDWLAEHVDPETGYVIDDTLTVTGAAADAKKTGDEINGLKNAVDETAMLPFMNKSGNVVTVNIAENYPLAAITDENATTVTITGANLWDEETRIGNYGDNSGNYQSEGTNLCNVNAIKIDANTDYYFVKPSDTRAVVYFYNSNYYNEVPYSQKYLGYQTVEAGTNIFTSPNNAMYMNFYMGTAYGQTYNNDLSVNYPKTCTEYGEAERTTENVSNRMVRFTGTGEQMNLYANSGEIRIVPDILSNGQLITNKLGYVTPEMFGAVGDGIEDDTAAWQAAVNVGLPVKAMHNTYNCGQINVTKNIDIDCCGASFNASGSRLFWCSGTVDATLTGEGNYTANQNDYVLTSTGYTQYTGFAMIKGSNNFEKSRNYYRGGFACTFINGKLTNTYPVTAENPEIDVITPVTVTIHGISNISGSDDSNEPLIGFKYGFGCRVYDCDIMDASYYNIVLFDSSIQCSVENCRVNLVYGESGTNSYIVDIGSSSFCTVDNCWMYNQYWHCVTTGGTYLCYHNVVNNCKAYTLDAVAIDDHENALNTIITNSVVSCIQVAGMAIVNNCNIVSTMSANGPCYIRLCAMSNKDSAVYTVKNIRFMPKTGSTSTYCGIKFTSSSHNAGSTYYIKDCVFDNVKCTESGSLAICTLEFATNSSHRLYRITVNNCNFDILAGVTTASSAYINISEYILIVSNCIGFRYNNQRTIQIGQSTLTFKDVYITNVDAREIVGKYSRLEMINVTTYNPISGITVSEHLYGSGINSNIADSALKAPTHVRITDYKSGSTAWFNVATGSDGNVYRQRYVSGQIETNVVS